MHWSEEIAKKIIAQRPDKAEYVCAAGISPSGSIHIGNFRDVATSWFVVKALRKLGKKAKLLFSWDEYDRMRKVPVNVAAVRDDMEQYIGCPYSQVPNPFAGSKAKTYAEYFEREFEASIDAFGIEMDYRHQAKLYGEGKYVPYVLTALRKRGEIFDILDRHRTQDAAEGEREAYYPVSIFCPKCGRDSTKVLSLSDDCRTAEYECACGHKAKIDFTKDFHYKLGWKIDWPMRWAYEGVDFEPGGKDHASINGSYDTSKEIARDIFGIEPPVFQGYEFIGIRGVAGKMSGSSGLNLTPETLLKIYQPEVILWLYSKTEPMKGFDFCFDDGILRQYFEFDKMLTAYRDGTADEYQKGIMYNALVEGRDIKTVPMGLLVQLGSVVNFDVPMLEVVFRKLGTPYTHAEFADRLERARYWLRQCAPENEYRLRSTRNWAVYDTLTDGQKKEIAELYKYLCGDGYTLDELNTELYAIPKRLASTPPDDKQSKLLQGEFFKNVYRLLLDREKGPRLYLFLFAIEKADYLPLLDFSYPITDAEIAAQKAEAEAAEQASAPPQKHYGEPDPVPPVKETVDIDAFAKLDLRVCQIVKCAEIRKSHNCLKLTLDDGIGERTIVSSIKHDYTPEQLIGRKIIVIANLAPTRITGVTSQGMLLAATNNACGCQVLFVDDSVPVGTPVK